MIEGCWQPRSTALRKEDVLLYRPREWESAVVGPVEPFVTLGGVGVSAVSVGVIVVFDAPQLESMVFCALFGY